MDEEFKLLVVSTLMGAMWFVFVFCVWLTQMQTGRAYCENWEPQTNMAMIWKQVTRPLWMPACWLSKPIRSEDD
jgi:hypothetical protein